MEQELTLIDYWRIIWRYKYIPAGLFIIFVTGAMLRGLSTPRTYKATATILSSSGVIGDIEMRHRSAGFSLGRSSSDIFMSLMKSRTIQDEIAEQIKELGLYDKEKTGIDPETGELRIFAPKPLTEMSDQLINISIIDTDPERAAKIANMYVEALDRFYLQFTVTAAGQKKKFLETRLAETMHAMEESAKALEEHKVKHKVSGARISTGGMEARLIAKRVELEARQKYRTPYHPEIIRIKNEIAEIEKALEEMPPVDSELAILIREVQIQENLYRRIITQYEQAKIEEARDTPTVQVVDWAIPPEFKHAPAIKSNMAKAGFIAIFLGFLLSFSLDYKTNMQKDTKKQ